MDFAMTVEIIRSPKRLFATREKAAEFFLQSRRWSTNLKRDVKRVKCLRLYGLQASRLTRNVVRYGGEGKGREGSESSGGEERMKNVGHVIVKSNLIT
jgi:hypothetical protein